MDTDALIEWVLERSVSLASTGEAPPLLAKAIHHAVFPGGARVRPRLCVAVAAACGEADCLPLAAAAGAAIELMHCGSLVHDDLPAFDAAELRRGNPSVHAAFGEPMAILAGDALIVMAFETLVREGARNPLACLQLCRILAEMTGSPRGIVAGQAWESEPVINLTAYHQAKTAALFVAATMSGAASAGADPARWRGLGIRLGEAYQIADDLRDVLLGEDVLGKPAGQDQAHSRPSAVEAFGLEGAFGLFSQSVEAAAAAVPDCAGAPFLRQIVAAQAARLVPKSLMQRVA
ncbi:MAG: geranylgeranyl pyrophosphate synthase [Hyphomonas sp.]|uniref:polyprenyl synthetase family protein n=1 Tax=Hyphomonas sp. TaxID=87 RepID=UPI001E123646|nr:polyprenyl synthetase family protein [Hyphomonas sp.]MBA4225965.1 geranylgeranyl pyrophosphate synthase [Hyphomonas sp.]